MYWGQFADFLRLYVSISFPTVLNVSLSKTKEGYKWIIFITAILELELNPKYMNFSGLIWFMISP